MTLQTPTGSPRGFRLPPWPRLRRRASVERPTLALGEAADDAAKPLSIPRRPSGKTAIDVTILNAGTGRGQGIQRILKFAYAQGIRCFDTSKKINPRPTSNSVEQSPRFARKLRGHQDLPRSPGEIIGKGASDWPSIGTDYLDLFFVHSFGDNHSFDEAIAFVKSREFKEAAERHPQSGGARLVGISDP